MISLPLESSHEIQHFTQIYQSRSPLSFIKSFTMKEPKSSKWPKKAFREFQARKYFELCSLKQMRDKPVQSNSFHDFSRKCKFFANLQKIFANLQKNLQIKEIF